MEAETTIRGLGPLHNLFFFALFLPPYALLKPTRVSAALLLTL